MAITRQSILRSIWAFLPFFTLSGCELKIRSISLNEINVPGAPTSATTLSWVGTSPRISTTLTASWTKSGSADLDNQQLQLFSDSTCTTTSGSVIDLGSSAAETNVFTVAGNGTYSFKVTSIDTQGNQTVSACSGPMTVSTPTFADNFDDGTIGNQWAVCATTGMYLDGDCNAAITISETGGQAAVSMPTASAGTWRANGFTSTALYDFTDSYMQIEMPAAPPTGDNGNGGGLLVEFGDSDNGGLYIYKSVSDLVVKSWYFNGAGSTWNTHYTGAFDGTNHRWLRLRHNSVTALFYAEVSPDGVTWTVLASFASPSVNWHLNETRLALFGERAPAITESAIRVAAFDNFATNAVKLDNFDDNTMAGWWASARSTGNTWVPTASANPPAMSESGNGLEFGLANTLTDYQGFVTQSLYDFTGAWLAVEDPLPPAGNDPACAVNAGIDLSLNGGTDDVQLMAYDNNELRVYTRQAAGLWVQAFSTPYNSTNHRWLRIRHDSSDGRIYFEVAPDGSSWSSVYDLVPWTPVTSGRALLFGGADGTCTLNQTTRLDNFSTNAVEN